MSAMMRAARVHRLGALMELDVVAVPEPGPYDVRVAVQAVNCVPNLLNVIDGFSTWFPDEHPLPSLPAIFGLDATGVIDVVGEAVKGFEVGDRVYVNPGRHCGLCRACQLGNFTACTSYAYAGYFGFGPGSVEVLDRYQGGLAEYMVAPAYSLVRLPENVSFQAAARFGYLGTMYSALRKAPIVPGTSVLVHGISGTLGIGAALLAPALGLTSLFGTGRNRDLLKQVDALAPGSFQLHSLEDGPVDEWIDDVTDGYGVDVYIDALGPTAPHETFLSGMQALARGGTAVTIGGVRGHVPINLHRIMARRQRLIGSGWFTTAEGQQLADLVGCGLVDLSPLKQEVYPLERINEALSGIASRNGGFSNLIISPSGEPDTSQTA